MPAGMFAAYHIQAMIEVSGDKDFRELFDTLGMVKTAGPFAGHTFEAYVHFLMVERGGGVQLVSGSSIPTPTRMYRHR